MPRKRILLVGSLINRNVDPLNFTGRDQLFQNCYPEVVNNAVTEQRKVYLNKRPGGDAAALTGVTRGSYASRMWTGGDLPALACVNTGGTSTSVFSSSGKIGGDIANTKECFELTETTVSNVANLVGIFQDSSTDALEGWFFPSGGAWTQIVDTDFPANQTPALTLTGAPAHMDGYCFVMCTNGQIWNSDLNSLSAWTAANYVTAQSSPDAGVGLARYKNMIVGFGTDSTELFRNNGNPTGSPLIKTGNEFRIGAVTNSNKRTILPVGDTVYWIGREADTGRRGIFVLNDFRPQKISTPAIDKILASDQSMYIAGSFTMHGLPHVMFSRSNSAHYCYCIDTNTWWQFNVAGSLLIAAICGSPANGITYFTTQTTAKRYRAGPSLSSHQDDGTNLTMLVQTGALDMGNDLQKFWNEIRVVGDRQASASNLAVSYSDDDGSTFSTAENIDLSSALPWRLGPHGASNKRVWKFSHAANTPCRLEAFDLAFDQEQDLAA